MGGMITRRSALAGCCTLPVACAHVDVRLGSFMSPDHGVKDAHLPPGYVVENQVLRRGEQSIGLTYARHPRSRAVILYSGGDAFHRSIEGAIPLQALCAGADVALFDYPGYGDSNGLPSTASILDTAVAAYDHVFGLDAARGKRRVLYGFSLGGMVVAQLAQDRPAEAIILESTALTVEGWARSRIPRLLRPAFRIRVESQIAGLNTASALDQFRGQVLLLTSRADERVPATLTFQLRTALERTQRDVRLVEFPGCRHGAIMRDPSFPGRLSEFLNRAQGFL